MACRLLLLIVVLVGLPVDVNTQCLQIGCCPGRDDNCISSGCYCDEACFELFNDCCPDFLSLCRGGNISPFPRFGTMLGGTRITVLGAFDGATTASCIFGTSPPVTANIMTGTTISCVSPYSFEAGRVALVVNINGIEVGRSNFLFQRPDELPNGVVRVNHTAWTKPGMFTLRWNEGAIRTSTVDIEVWAYRENTPGVPEFEKVHTIASDVPDAGSRVFNVRSTGLLIPFERMVAIRVVENGESSAASLWSDMHVPQYFFPIDNAKDFCSGWFLDEAIKDLSFLPVRQACPCDLASARIDSCAFSPDPLCNMLSNRNDPMNCYRKPGAVHCVRARAQSSLGGGQECCYSQTGRLLNSLASDGGGLSHRVHHDALVPFFSNFWADTAPWFECCRFTNAPLTCTFYRRIRRSQMCGGYVGPRMSWGGGDPHFLTLDELVYTFNGLGEYLYVDIGDGQFVVQIQTGQVPGVQATAIVAVAAKHMDSDTFHMGVSNNQEDVWILTETETIGVDFSMQSTWESKGLRVTQEVDDESMAVVVQYDDAIALNIRSNLNMLVVTILMPDSLRNLPAPSRGLLGIWNGDRSDDLTDRNGTLHTNASLDVHAFGLTWIVPVEDALFYRPPGSMPPYSFPEFQPDFEPVNAQISPQMLQERCKGNKICEFDYQATGSENIAENTLGTVDLFEENIIIVKQSEVNCEPLPDISNGRAMAFGSMVGDNTTYTCDDGFILMGMEVTTCISDGLIGALWTNPPPECLLNIAPIVERCPENWNYVEGKCYRIFSDGDVEVSNTRVAVPTDYVGRKQVCQFYQGTLAILEPYAAISLQVGFPTEPGQLIAIGLDDQEQEGTYRWLDGKIPTETNWGLGQPSTLAGNDCVYVQSNTLQWISNQCGTPAQFICQRHTSRDNSICNSDPRTAIGYLLGSTSDESRCVATLINTKWAVTSASCNRGNRVVFGTATYTESPELISTAQVRGYTLVPHPLYDRSSADYDIALMFLDEAVVIGGSVNPMCVDTSPSPSFTSCLSSSWGNSINNDNPASVLQTTSFQTTTLCQTLLDPYFNAGIKVCIGNFEQGALVPCERDTGAPFYCQDGSGGRVLVGVTADGFCSSPANGNTLEVSARLSTNAFIATTESALFDCAGNGVVFGSQLCDNLFECPFGDDEIGCPAAPLGSTFAISSPKFGATTNLVDRTWLFRALASSVRVEITFIDLPPESGSLTIGQGTDPRSPASLLATVGSPLTVTAVDYMWIRYRKTSVMTGEGMQATVTIA